MKLLFIWIFSSLLTAAFGQTKWLEKDYADRIQELIGGEREFSVYSGRVDLVTDSFAIEIEYANKWKNSIGQALWYAVETNKTPGIILILKDPKEYKYVIQLHTTLTYAGLAEKVKVWRYPDDFEK